MAAKTGLCEHLACDARVSLFGISWLGVSAVTIRWKTAGMACTCSISC